MSTELKFLLSWKPIPLYWGVLWKLTPYTIYDSNLNELYLNDNNSSTNTKNILLTLREELTSHLI